MEVDISLAKHGKSVLSCLINRYSYIVSEFKYVKNTLYFRASFRDHVWSGVWCGTLKYIGRKVAFSSGVFVLVLCKPQSSSNLWDVFNTYVLFKAELTIWLRFLWLYIGVENVLSERDRKNNNSLIQWILLLVIV